MSVEIEIERTVILSGEDAERLRYALNAATEHYDGECGTLDGSMLAWCKELTKKLNEGR